MADMARQDERRIAAMPICADHQHVPSHATPDSVNFFAAVWCEKNKKLRAMLARLLSTFLKKSQPARHTAPYRCTAVPRFRNRTMTSLHSENSLRTRSSSSRLTCAIQRASIGQIMQSHFTIRTMRLGIYLTH
jgi:hypothetical protein